MAVELVPGVWWLQLRGVNAYLYEGDGETVLVDAGFPWQAGALRAELAEAGTGPDEVDRVAVTHYDPDHVGGLAGLGLDVPVHAGAADAAVLSGERRPALANRKGLFHLVTRPFVRGPPGPVLGVADGETVAGLAVRETPGHTAGHVAYVDEAAGVAFLGDLVRSTGDALAPSPWYMSADTAAVRRSLRAMVVDGPAFDAAAPGHGRPLRTGGSEALAALVA